METLAKEDVTAAHKLFIDTVLPVMEELVPPRVTGKRFGKSTKHKNSRCLWRKLSRIKKRLLSTSSVKRAASLLETKQNLEKELKKLYASQGWEEENKVVKAMKSNI